MGKTKMVGEAGLEPAKAKPADLQSAPFAARDIPPPGAGKTGPLRRRRPKQQTRGASLCEASGPLSTPNSAFRTARSGFPPKCPPGQSQLAFEKRRGGFAINQATKPQSTSLGAFEDAPLHHTRQKAVIDRWLPPDKSVRCANQPSENLRRPIPAHPASAPKAGGPIFTFYGACTPSRRRSPIPNAACAA